MNPRGTVVSGANNALFTKLRDAGFPDTPQDEPALFKSRRRRRLIVRDAQGEPRAEATKPIADGGSRELTSSCAEGLETSFFFEMVFEAVNSGGVLTLETMQSLCAFEAEFNAFTFDAAPPCEFRALHNHVASFFGIGTCRNITQEHVQNYTDVLVDCHAFYESGQLFQCFSAGCGPGVPERCSRDDLVFDSLHSLVDKGFSPARPTVELTKLIRVRDLSSEETETVHFEFLPEKVGEAFGNAKLSGYGDTFGEYKFDVFSTQLLMDIAFAGLALGLIFTIMFVHTQSLFITTFAFMQILLALSVSFGIYNIVLWLPFFPYLNLVSGKPKPEFVLRVHGRSDLLAWLCKNE